jgi:hypothetical protein
MVLIVLSRNFSAKGVVASMMGKRGRQWVSACGIGAQAARFDVDFIRVSNAYTLSKCPLYNTSKSVVGGLTRVGG